MTPRAAAPVIVPSGWTVARGALATLAFPPSWQPLQDPQGLSWAVGDGAEVYLSLFRFEEEVPPLSIFVASNRSLLDRPDTRITLDRSIDHDSGWPAWVLGWRTASLRPPAWTFLALFLRSDRAIHLLKLDRPGEAAPDAPGELERVFASLRPVG